MTVYQVPIFGEFRCSRPFSYFLVVDVRWLFPVFTPQLRWGQKSSPPSRAGAAPLEVLPPPGWTTSTLTTAETVREVQVSPGDDCPGSLRATRRLGRLVCHELKGRSWIHLKITWITECGFDGCCGPIIRTTVEMKELELSDVFSTERVFHVAGRDASLVVAFICKVGRLCCDVVILCVRYTGRSFLSHVLLLYFYSFTPRKEIF